MRPQCRTFCFGDWPRVVKYLCRSLVHHSARNYRASNWIEMELFRGRINNSFGVMNEHKLEQLWCCMLQATKSKLVKVRRAQSSRFCQQRWSRSFSSGFIWNPKGVLSCSQTIKEPIPQMICISACNGSFTLDWDQYWQLLQWISMVSVSIKFPIRLPFCSLSVSVVEPFRLMLLNQQALGFTWMFFLLTASWW